MKNVTVEVTKPNLKDSKYFNQELEITRRGEKIKVIQKLLQVGDKFETDVEHAEYLEKLGVVKILSKKDKMFDDITD